MITSKEGCHQCYCSDVISEVLHNTAYRAKFAEWAFYTESKNDQQYYSFITLANVGWLKKFFHLWMQHDVCNKILSDWHVLAWCASDSTVTACHVRDLLRVLYLPAKQCVSSWMCTDSISVFPIWDFWNGRHPRLFHQTCVARTHRSQPSKLQSLHRNPAAGLSKKSSQHEWNDILVWLSWLWATHHQ